MRSRVQTALTKLPSYSKMPKTQKDRPQSQKCRWHFTIKADQPELAKDGHAVIISWLKGLGAKKYCFQLEKGATGYLHYQGKVSFARGRRLNEIRGLGAHWSIESNAGQALGDLYVIKHEGRVKGPWSDKDATARYVPKHLRALVLRPEQRWIKERLEGQDGRQILFVVDGKGGTGKSTLGMWMCVSGDALRLPSSLKSAEDCSQALFPRVYGREDKVFTIILDIPRSVKKESQWAIWLAALEDIKNGHIYDKRYSFKECFFERPRVLVFANSAPPSGLLTSDRYDVWDMLQIMQQVGNPGESGGDGGGQGGVGPGARRVNNGDAAGGNDCTPQEVKADSLPELPPLPPLREQPGRDGRVQFGELRPGRGLLNSFPSYNADNWVDMDEDYFDSLVNGPNPLIEDSDCEVDFDTLI